MSNIDKIMQTCSMAQSVTNIRSITKFSVDPNNPICVYYGRERVFQFDSETESKTFTDFMNKSLEDSFSDKLSSIDKSIGDILSQ